MKNTHTYEHNVKALTVLVRRPSRQITYTQRAHARDGRTGSIIVPGFGRG